MMNPDKKLVGLIQITQDKPNMKKAKKICLTLLLMSMSIGEAKNALENTVEEMKLEMLEIKQTLDNTQDELLKTKQELSLSLRMTEEELNRKCENIDVSIKELNEEVIPLFSTPLPMWMDQVWILPLGYSQLDSLVHTPLLGVLRLVMNQERKL